MRALNKYQQSKLDGAFKRAFREDARVAQKSYCFYCEEPLTAKTATADHVKPRAVFGLDHRNNIVAACHACNRLKGHQPVNEFKNRICTPRHGDDIQYWLMWFNRNVNRRLRLMSRRLGVEK